MKRVSKNLPSPLNDSEVAALAREQNDHLDQLKQLKLDKTESAKAFKDRITVQEAEVERLGRQIEKNEGDKDVPCVEILRQGEIITIRLDNGEEVDRRMETLDEKQVDLFEEEDPADKIEAERIDGLFDLLDLLKADGGMSLGRNLQPFWNISEEQSVEARAWVASRKQADEAGDGLPEPPAWLKAIEEESQSAALGEEEFRLRANTIKAALLEQDIVVEDTDIKQWSLLEQNMALEWTDSIGGDAALNRPAFLSRYLKKTSEEASEGDETETDETAEDVQELGNADTTEPAEAEAEGESEPTEPEPMKRDDLWRKIKALGPKVSRTKVREFTVEEAAEAQAWVEDTEKAVEVGGERHPAPAFLVKTTDE